MKYYIIAGEASGDLHGGNLIRAIRTEDLQADIRCWGGDQMHSAGGVIVKHIRELAFMGFAEVMRNLPAIFRNIRFCKKDILNYQPDALILIDYPGFNLRIARWARKQNLKIIYYISPQIWAWKESRIKQIKKNIDKMLVILPFEKTFYEKHHYEVEYVGHPLLPVIDRYSSSHTVKNDGKIVALLPGSRKQEIRAKLPIMLAITHRFPDCRFFIGKAPAIDDEFYSIYLKDFPQVQLRSDTYDLLMESRAALVTSGTATLEVALFRIPEVVCYKTSRISYEIGKRLVKLKYICIVNLIMNKEVVRELIQDELTPENLALELERILYDKGANAEILSDYTALRDKLYFHGDASENAARAIVKFIS